MLPAILLQLLKELEHSHGRILWRPCGALSHSGFIVHGSVSLSLVLAGFGKNHSINNIFVLRLVPVRSTLSTSIRLLNILSHHIDFEGVRQDVFHTQMVSLARRGLLMMETTPGAARQVSEGTGNVAAFRYGPGVVVMCNSVNSVIRSFNNDIRLPTRMLHA